MAAAKRVVKCSGARRGCNTSCCAGASWAANALAKGVLAQSSHRDPEAAVRRRAARQEQGRQARRRRGQGHAALAAHSREQQRVQMRLASAAGAVDKKSVVLRAQRQAKSGQGLARGGAVARAPPRARTCAWPCGVAALLTAAIIASYAARWSSFKLASMLRVVDACSSR